MPAPRKRRQHRSGSITRRELKRPKRVRLADGTIAEVFELFDVALKFPSGHDENGRTTYARVHRRGFVSKAEAEAFVSERKAAALKGGIAPSKKSGPTLVEWLYAYEATMEELGEHRPKVASNNLGHIRRHIAPVFGEVLLTELTTHSLQNYIVKLSRRGLATSSVRQIVAVVSGGLRYAFEQGVIADNPYPGVRLPKRKRARKKALPDELIVQVLEELASLDREDLEDAIRDVGLTAAKLRASLEPDARDEAEAAAARSVLVRIGSRATPAIRFLALTGMRRSEALGLEWRHVDLVNGRVEVEQSLTYVPGDTSSLDPDRRVGRLVVGEPKTENSWGSRRLQSGVIALLKAHQAEQRERLIALGVPPTPNTPVFDDGLGGWRMPDSITRAWVRARKRAGVDGIQLRHLRDHAGSVMLRVAHPRTVAEQLGHDPATLLRFYARPDDELLDEAASAVEESIGLGE